MDKRIVVPFAPILVESTRSIGYSFEAAVADVIDNSISAGASEIRVCFMSQDPQWLCIEDDVGIVAPYLHSPSAICEVKLWMSRLYVVQRSSEYDGVSYVLVCRYSVYHSKPLE